MYKFFKIFNERENLFQVISKTEKNFKKNFPEIFFEFFFDQLKLFYWA